MRAVNPDATDEQIQQAFETSGGGAAGPPQVFQQALAGTRSAAATAALSEATSRRDELVHIEETLVELAQLMQQVRPLLLSLPSFPSRARTRLTSATPARPQVADLVITQDSTLSHLETTADAVRADLEQGTKQVGLARASAAAARHKRQMCAAFGLVLVVVLVVVVAVEVKKAGAGETGKETQTVTAGATEAATAAASAVASVARMRW